MKYCLCFALAALFYTLPCKAQIEDGEKSTAETSSSQKDLVGKFVVSVEFSGRKVRFRWEFFHPKGPKLLHRESVVDLNAIPFKELIDTPFSAFIHYSPLPRHIGYFDFPSEIDSAHKFVWYYVKDDKWYVSMDLQIEQLRMIEMFETELPRIFPEFKGLNEGLRTETSSTTSALSSKTTEGGILSDSGKEESIAGDSKTDEEQIEEPSSLTPRELSEYAFQFFYRQFEEMARRNAEGNGQHYIPAPPIELALAGVVGYSAYKALPQAGKNVARSAVRWALVVADPWFAYKDTVRSLDAAAEEDPDFIIEIEDDLTTLSLFNYFFGIVTWGIGPLVAGGGPLDWGREGYERRQEVERKLQEDWDRQRQERREAERASISVAINAATGEFLTVPAIEVSPRQVAASMHAWIRAHQLRQRALEAQQQEQERTEEDETSGEQDDIAQSPSSPEGGG